MIIIIYIFYNKNRRYWRYRSGHKTTYVL